MLWAARDYARAGEYRTRGARRRAVDRRCLLVAHSLNRVGNWHVNREDPRSGIPFHEEALAIFERRAIGAASPKRSTCSRWRITSPPSRRAPSTLYERSIKLFTALEHRRGLANALSVLLVCGPSHHASAAPRRDERADGRATNDRAHAQADGEIGWRAGESFSRYCLADR